MKKIKLINKRNDKKLDPFKNLVLDPYEQEIEDAMERGEFVHVKDFEENKKMFEEAAKRYSELKKSKSVTFRMKNENLIELKAKAKKREIPYQTILNLLAKKYIDGGIDLSL